MDRLPRDVASERLHHDIVRLLDEHVPRSPQMVNVIPNGGLISSPNHHHQMITHPTVIGPAPKQSKSKKRPKPGNTAPADPTSPEVEGASTVVRRKPSVKKNNKKLTGSQQQTEIAQSVDSVTSTLSPVESPLTNLPSPYDTASIYSNAMAMGFEGALLSNKQPPSYEDCIKNAQSISNLHSLNLDNHPYNGAYNLPSFHEQLLVQQRQMQPNTLSPPYSNQSPPHSVQSNMSMSPQAFTGSPSPAKTRPSLPTSPTHIAAMRAATHQKHGGIPQTQNLPMGFDFTQAGLEGLSMSYNQASGLTPPITLQPQQYQQNNYQYLTPPSQHSVGADATPQHLLQAPDNFPTPSPESPGHWSSSSPHSCTSDWSENITSPNAYVSGAGGHQSNKGSEAIYI